MLKIANNIHQIRFSELMGVYREANKDNGAKLYPNLPEYEQLIEAEQDFYQYLESVFFMQDDSVYCIWTVDDRYCSALRLEPYRDGMLLCGVETEPFLRRRGYAAKLIRAVQNYLLTNGTGIIYSHVSKRNEASLLLHKKCGFRVISDHAVYSDGSVMHNSYTLSYTYKQTERSV